MRTDKHHKPNFGVLVQVPHMQDDTNAEGKQLTSFMLIKTCPFWFFAAHLFAGYDIFRLWVSGFPTNTGMKITNCECLSFPFWLLSWFYLHMLKSFTYSWDVWLANPLSDPKERGVSIWVFKVSTQDGPQIKISSLYKSRRSVRGKKFHSWFAFFVSFRVLCSIWLKFHHH